MSGARSAEWNETGYIAAPLHVDADEVRGFLGDLNDALRSWYLEKLDATPDAVRRAEERRLKRGGKKAASMPVGARCAFLRRRARRTWSAPTRKPRR